MLPCNLCKHWEPFKHAFRVPGETLIQARLPLHLPQVYLQVFHFVLLLFHTPLLLSSGNVKIYRLVAEEGGKSQAAVQSSDCESPAGVHFSGIFMYSHKVDGEVLVSLFLWRDF